MPSLIGPNVLATPRTGRSAGAEVSARPGSRRHRYAPHRMGGDYEFLTVWRVAATVEEVKAILGDGPALPDWWPSVYLAVDVLEEAGPDGAGSVIELHTKGWLPYTLRWTLHITEPITDGGFALRATGDLEGTGVWTFVPDGPEVEITLDWRVHASKPLLRRMGWLLKPAFAANHVWGMRRGEESLRLELRRRRAADGAASAVPPPRGPTFDRLLRLEQAVRRRTGRVR
jgi:hypothetical protein